MNIRNVYIKPIIRQGFLTALAGSMLFLGGCSATSSSVRAVQGPVTHSMSESTQVSETSAVESYSKVTICNRELQALKGINAAEYSRYHREMNHLVASGQRYMNVKDEISSDINDIMTPRYQFGMASLCWKIRNALSESLLSEASIPQERKP
ncbi:hypothetical protein RI049_18280 [Cedecea neteri]|uniref:hypothetical protein n=1 Tax=Cedecea neteri TaxID=158822 RepID=UPI002AA8A5FC|nr:hypothetical protein [Cedecea neteri]WPU21978.1 hypothetical protein RI049_18280 [Cedecea neteri]